jgi:CRP-like cAMP-binding protein
VSAIIEKEGAEKKRVRVFGPQTLIGEIAFMLHVPRTASLRVDEDTIVWSLERRVFSELVLNRPKLVMALLQDVVRLQAERLAFATRQIAALQS